MRLQLMILNPKIAYAAKCTGFPTRAEVQENAIIAKRQP